MENISQIFASKAVCISSDLHIEVGAKWCVTNASTTGENEALKLHKEALRKNFHS